MRGLLIALLMSQAIASPIIAEAPAVSVSAPSREALALAEAVSPQALYLEREIDSARRTFFGGAEVDADMKSLETEHPGVMEAMWDAAEPELRRSTVQDLPAYRVLLAEVYQRRLTAAEMVRLRDFYLSPGGQRMIRAIFAPPDLQPLIKDIYAGPEAKVSAGAMDALQRQAVDRARDTVDPADTASLELLVKAAPAGKLRAVGEDIKKAMLDWVNKPNPEVDAKLEALMIDAIEDFIEKDAEE